MRISEHVGHPCGSGVLLDSFGGGGPPSRDAREGVGMSAERVSVRALPGPGGEAVADYAVGPISRERLSVNFAGFAEQSGTSSYDGWMT